MNLRPQSLVRRITLYLGLAIAAMVIVHLILQYLNMDVFYQQNGPVYELSNRFDLDDESSVPTWFSQVLFLLISASAFLASIMESSLPRRNIWRLIALGTLIFSIDEIATLHEFTLQTVHVLFFGESSPTGLSNAWLLLLPFVLAIGLWLIWQIARHFPRKMIIQFALAGSVFIFGAVFVDILASTVARDTFLNQGIIVAVEETFELVASLIVLYAILRYIETENHAKLSKAWSQIKA